MEVNRRSAEWNKFAANAACEPRTDLPEWGPQLNIQEPCG